MRTEKMSMPPGIGEADQNYIIFMQCDILGTVWAGSWDGLHNHFILPNLIRRQLNIRAARQLHSGVEEQGDFRCDLVRRTERADDKSRNGLPRGKHGAGVPIIVLHLLEAIERIAKHVCLSI